jgi:hypothetical protein
VNSADHISLQDCAGWSWSSLVVCIDYAAISLFFFFLVFFFVGFTSHQYCKGCMATFQLNWWKKTSGVLPCIISDMNRHLSRTTNIL